MYKLLFDGLFIDVSKEKFFEFIDFYSLSFVIVKVLTCSDTLKFGLSLDGKHIASYIGQTKDPDFLLPFQEAMFD